MQADRDGEPSRRRSLDFSDLGDDDGSTEEHTGNYSTRMEELFDDDEDEHIRPARTNGVHLSDEEDDDEPFVYNGVDAEPHPVSYRDQLRDVLDDDDASGSSEREVEHSLLQDAEEEVPSVIVEEAPVSPFVSYLYTLYSCVYSTETCCPTTLHLPRRLLPSRFRARLRATPQPLAMRRPRLDFGAHVSESAGQSPR